MVSGVVLGLTGAGGGIISVPMFIYLGGASIIEATILSLLTVAFCSVFAWYFQRKKTYIELSLVLAAFSLLSSHFFAPIKKELPDWTVLFSFILVTVGGLIWAWKNSGRKETKTGLTRAETRNIPFLAKASVGGLVLGIVTVMTGLGGGVLMTPFMSGALGMSLGSAVATSLLAIVIATIGAAWVQHDQIAKFLSPELMGAMIVGAFVAAMITRKILSGMSELRVDFLRRVVLTIVVVISIVGSLVKKYG